MKNSFTLIELLVVTAVIAVLVSILMPSLAKSRYMARLAVCASNINQTSKGALLYTQNNNNRFPKNNSNNPYDTYVIKEGPHFNHGILAEVDYIDPQVIFCPQNEVGSAPPPFVYSVYNANKDIRHKTIYSQRFNLQNGEIVIRKKEKRARSSYNFLPIQKRINYLLPQLENNQLFIVDNFLSKSRTAHKQYSKEWNVLKIDGSMKLVKSSEIYAKLPSVKVSGWTLIGQLTKIFTK